jgi:Tfp pilus assembly protein PilV
MEGNPVPIARRAVAERLESEHGLGLIEIVISMFLLALLAIAFAPLLIAGLRSSAANTTTVTAIQLVNERMQIAQASGPSCSAVASLAGDLTLTDPRGVTIEVTTTVAACPSGSGTVDVTTTAVRSDSGGALAEASTLVFVE